MQNFVVSILVKVLTNPDVLAQIEKLIGNVVAKQILPLVPVAVGAAVKTAIDDIVEKVPGLEGVVDIAKTTEAAVSGLEQLIPGGKFLGDLLAGWGIGI